MYVQIHPDSVVHFQIADHTPPVLTLTAGEKVIDGTTFRNGAHLRFTADILVPCGGRPESVNIGNVSRLFNSDGKPHFKVVVEGANLFFTQQARLYLEKRGVVLFKDSSANKGGVTSSSLEVLAGLGLSDEEYLDLMIFKNGKPSSFYTSYVKDIQEKICENGRMEFEAIWAEHLRRVSLSSPSSIPSLVSNVHLTQLPFCLPIPQKGAVSRTLLSDELSSSLNVLQVELEDSVLYDQVESRRNVLIRAIPKTLVDKVGIDALMKRLPEEYLRALWSAYVSSHFVYEAGVGASQVAFFLFFSNFAAKA